jgi:hypothetical protein
MARAEVFAPDEVAIVQVMNRVVLRCYLLGNDPLSGKNYDHRKVMIENQLQRLASAFGIDLLGFAIMSNHFHLILRSCPEKDDPGDTKIISVCRVSIANDGGAGGDRSISRGTESQVFRGRAAGKRMRTRSSRNKANENPCLVDFSTSEGIVNLPQSVFLGSILLRRWQ